MAEGDARRLDLPGTCLWSAPRQPGLPGPHHVGEWVSLGGPERVGTEGVHGLLPSPPQVLITKLRSANSAETRQYHKASKALLVLIPLLGITYLVLLYAPSDGFLRHAFAFLRACLISTQVGGEGRAGSRGTQSQSPSLLLQGFFVSLLYCFLNSEVRVTLRHRYRRWKEGQVLRNRR